MGNMVFDQPKPEEIAASLARFEAAGREIAQVVGEAIVSAAEVMRKLADEMAAAMAIAVREANTAREEGKHEGPQGQ